MAEFSPLKTGQLVIRLRSPWRRRSLVMGGVIALLLVPYLAYEAGRWASGYSIVEATQERLEHAERVHKLEEQLAGLQSTMASAELARNLDRQSHSELEKTLADLQTEVRAQRDDLAMYQAIVSPQDGSSGPRVQRIDISPGIGDSHYQLKLLLIQSLLQEAKAGGSLKIEIAGTRDSQAVTLPLAQLSGEGHGDDALAFSFRYFQELEQEVLLPEGFVPNAINVELKSNRQGIVRQSFPWQPQVNS